MGVSYAITGLIVMVNYFLKIIILKLVQCLRHKTVSKETYYVMLFVFIATFVNTGILIFLNDANFTDIDGGFGPLSQIFFLGTLTDFNEKFYRTTGMLLMRTMLITAGFPIAELAMWWTINNLKRLYDRGFTSNVQKTKMPSLVCYVDLYSGPEYLIHYRYSSILLLVSVSLLYGGAMPLLYPISALGFLVLHIQERLLVCYYYREPPSFDEKLTKQSITLISLMPLISLPFAFW
jgi:hypothetical protein